MLNRVDADVSVTRNIRVEDLGDETHDRGTQWIAGVGGGRQKIISVLTRTTLSKQDIMYYSVLRGMIDAVE